ncbi:hypothetical protein phiPsa267_005 [Pseudomonas phage phiPsa267]|uniref:Uncharacterized protein n=2 Tax=Otagovirus TaxID=2560197 RepID=A0A7G9V166_9CAUD|nr:hypothetical protein QGX16_gp005 [Pseudomonas phage phiPsa397]YP_010767615.1 hypothetical protein QGX19_gp005 [Pseudomonas phage phiPsa267]QNO00022.1 hypothetical protein phiPsa267_005 [Pseudomonas phage phiPsa267]QNO00882.1 hypothetical protein phiPsa397_005 [Pseudomonas phage phiPsa397]
MKGENPTGWMAYIRKWREKFPLEEPNYKALLQQYIKGIRLDDTHEGEPV